MAKTLLDCVNQVLIRVGDLKSTDLLASLSDAAIQSGIDIAVQVINEGIDDLYQMPGQSKPTQWADGSITLVTSTNAYAPPSGMERIHWPLQDRTNGQYIREYGGGYEQLLLDQIVPSNYTGLPLYAAIRPSDGYIYVDATPTSDENGLVYNFGYDKFTELTAIADTVPFSDAVFRAMVPVWAQLWKRDKRQEFDGALYKKSLARAAGFITKSVPRETTRRQPAPADPP